MKKISDLILHKDHYLIVLNKPSGIPTQEDKSGDTSIHRMAMAYAHRDLYLIHRLDRRVSGILLLAKTKEAAAAILKQWGTEDVKKTYLAIVPLAEIPTAGDLHHYLTYDTKQNITHASNESTSNSDEAKLSYEIVQRLDNFMVLKIVLHTGRKHQIRAQLSALGVPVRGDIKYGSKRTNENGGIDLHAYELEIMHPSTKERKLFRAPLPEDGLWTLVQV